MILGDEMKALILAVGKGERLRLVNSTKVLEHFLGLSLLERVILSAREAGVKEFYIVVGYRGDDVITALGDGTRFGVRINYLRNEQWEKGNGRSVLVAKNKLKRERFFLLMGDHLFDSSILKRLSGVEFSGSCLACVDKNLPTIFNLPEAMKVLVEDDHIRSIGKDIRKFNAVDCGIFLCTGEIFDAIEKSIANRRDKLSQAIALLAKRDRAEALDISDSFWFDIDTPVDLKEAKKRMLKSLTRRGDGVVSKLLNRKISTRISSRLVDWNISPNAISWMVFFIGVLAASLFLSGEYLFIALGGLIVQLVSIVDGCDGEIARLKFLRSKYGALLDSVLDRYVDALLIAGLTYGYWHIVGGGLVWLIGLAALIGSLGISYTRARYESAFASPIPVGRSIPATRDVRLFIIMLGALLNQVFVMLAILAILTNAEVIRRMIIWKKST